MWLSLVGEVIKGWVGMKTTKYKAAGERAMALAKVEADYDLEALRAQKDSWKDEVFLYVFLSPLVVAWFNPEKAMQWVDFVSALPAWFQFMLIGMMAAVFGLRWYVKNQNMKIVKGFKK